MKSDFGASISHTGATGKTYSIYPTKTGSNPVLLLHELPGMTQGALCLAREMERYHYKVYTPKLFGWFGQNKFLIGLLQTGISSRFSNFKAHESGSFPDDLRSMLDLLHNLHPDEKLTVIGNCLTGGSPLQILDHPSVGTVVLCQPAVPFTVGFDKKTREKKKRSWGFPEEALDRAGDLLEKDTSKRIIIFQYARDKNSSQKKIIELTKRIPENARARFLVFSAMSDKDTNAKALANKCQWTPVPITDVTGHSTLTGAEPEDRMSFRKILLRELNH